MRKKGWEMGLRRKYHDSGYMKCETEKWARGSSWGKGKKVNTDKGGTRDERQTPRLFNKALRNHVIFP